jgi:hyaluronoglucosaminidase
MLRKFLSIIALSVAALSLAPTAASASTGYQFDNVDDGNATPGQTVNVNFNGFKPGSAVTLTFNSVPVVLGTFTANAQGVVRVSAQIPAGAAYGNHTIVASGIDRTGAAKTASISIAISATGTASPGGGLPATGGDIALILGIGGLTVASGWGVLGAARRRQVAA